MHFEIIEDENRFYRLETVWNDLLSRSGSDNIFSTFEWNSAFWECFKQNRRLRIYVFYKNDNIVAIIPLMLQRHEGFRELTILGARNRDYEDFIILPEFREEIFADFFKSVFTQNDWDLLCLNRLREDSPNFAFLHNCNFNHSRFHSKICGTTAIVPIDCEWPLYVKKLPKEVHPEQGRRMRRLKKRFVDAEYKNIVDMQQIQTLFGKLVGFHRLRRQSKGDRSIFTNNHKLAFHKSIIKRLWEKGWLNFSALTIGERVLAVHYGFRYHGVYYSFISAFDSEYSNYSPGRHLRIHLLEQSFGRKDKEFDLLFGDENYKKAFNPVIRNLYAFYYFRPTVAGRLASWWWIGFRPRIKSVVTHIKPVLEQLTNSK